MKVPLRVALLREYFNLARCYFSDFVRYSRYACVGWNRLQMDPKQLEGRIIATYHVVEKGLSMPEFRPGFGIPGIKGLIRMLRETEDHCGWQDNVNLQTGRQVVRAYFEKHEKIGHDFGGQFTNKELEFAKDTPPRMSLRAGVEEFEHQDYFEKADASFSEFAKTRHSCRVFDPTQKVDPEIIRSAVETARFAPSVCNRQCWRVHIFQEKSKVEELLSYQGGNRGFGHTVPNVIVLTAKLQVFAGYAERSQGYYDGGLFGMALMFAFHHLKIGSVPLCWLVPLSRDREFRNIANIPDDEVILMLLGFGIPKDSFSVPTSQRRDVDELVEFHE
ncbi:nitroreductase family protein [Akkermansiaceae bacterium]|nr:nitroreductase family protein [Akkermansiaceae bacterium]